MNPEFNEEVKNIMSEGFNNGWVTAVKWIIELSEYNRFEIGANPTGDMVKTAMMNLGNQPHIDSGFAEGLIYAIGKPLSVLKSKIDKP